MFCWLAVTFTLAFSNFTTLILKWFMWDKCIVLSRSCSIIVKMIALKSPCPITYTSRKAELNNSRPVKCHCESTISLTQIYPLVSFLFVLNFCFLFVCLFVCLFLSNICYFVFVPFCFNLCNQPCSCMWLLRRRSFLDEI